MVNEAETFELGGFLFGRSRAVYLKFSLYIFRALRSPSRRASALQSSRNPSNSGGAIDPVPVEYRRHHRLKAELT